MFFKASSKLECEAAASRASFSLRESCLKMYSACMASCFVAKLRIGQQAHGQPSSRVLGPLASVVRRQPCLHIHGIARVQRAVGAFQHVHVVTFLLHPSHPGFAQENQRGCDCAIAIAPAASARPFVPPGRTEPRSSSTDNMPRSCPHWRPYRGPRGSPACRPSGTAGTRSGP